MTGISERPAVLVEGLQRSYGARAVIRGLHLRIERGEFVALIGESGCGKTTLLRAVAGLDRADGGRITCSGRPAMVFQEHRLLPWASLWQNVALGLGGPDTRALAAAALAEVGLGDRLDDWPRALSGGQAQRVALARALVEQPHLLLLDEPFAALDALTRVRMHGLVKRLVAHHRPGVLLVTHDVDEAVALADRVIAMRDGVLTASYAVPPAAKGNRAHPEAAALRGLLLEQLGAAEIAA